MFVIDEVTMFEGENWSDKTYAVAGDILDGYLYDLFIKKNIKVLAISTFLRVYFLIVTVRSNLEWLKNLDRHPLVDSTCPCIHYKTCEWSSELTRLVNPLPKSNPQRRRAVKFMKSVICDKRKRKLRCCAEREPIVPPDLSPLPPIGNDTVRNI